MSWFVPTLISTKIIVIEIIHQVVDEQSAQLNLPNEKVFPVHADHRTICKMSSPEDQVYKIVGVWIAKLIKAKIEEIIPIENDRMLFSDHAIAFISPS